MPLIACVVVCAGCPAEDAGKQRSLDPVRAFAYEESTDGLKKLFRDMLGGIADRDRRFTEHLARSLVLSEPSAFFKQTFGTRLGEALHAEYEPLTPDFASMANLLLQLYRDGQTRFVVERFTDPKDQAATGYQALALDKMRKATALYSVRAVTADSERSFHIWSFVYQRGYFRWIGKTRAAAEGEPDPPEIAGDIDAREYRIRDLGTLRKAAGAE